MGSICSAGVNWSTSIVRPVASGSPARSSSVSTTVSPVGSGYPFATSAYATSSSQAEHIRLNLICPASVLWTWRNAMSRCSVAAKSFTGMVTRPNEIVPFQMLRIINPYPSGPVPSSPD